MKSLSCLLFCALVFLNLGPVKLKAQDTRRVAMTRQYTDPRAEDSRPVLVRELFRQAFLMSARHELGMQTVDEVMGNDVAAAEDALLVKPHMSIPFNEEMAQLALFVEEESKPRWQIEIKSVDMDRDIGIIAAEMEELSRTVFPGLIRDWAKNPPTKADMRSSLDEAKVEADSLECHLIPFDIASQVSAIRKLHRALTEHGDSPERLSQIARAYGNLYQLTPSLPNGLTQVFAARAMLYGNRAAFLFPDNDEAIWSRGYSYVMAGSIVPAAKSFAHKVEAQPDWMEIATYLSRFDANNLDLICQDDESEYRSTAAHALHLVWPVQSAKWVSTMQRLTEVAPFDFAMDAHIARFSGVGIRGGALGQAIEKWKSLFMNFLVSDEVPEGMGTRRVSYPALIDSIRSLEDDDNSEFSMETIAHVFDDYGFFLHWMYIQFEVSDLGVDARQTTDSYRTMFGSHRNWELMELMRDSERDLKSAEMLEKIDRQRWMDSTPIAGFVLPFYQQQIDQTTYHLHAINHTAQWKRSSSSVWEFQNYCYRAMRLFTNTPFSNHVSDSYLALAPDSPHAHYILFTDQGGKFESKWNDFRTRFANHPGAFYAAHARAATLAVDGRVEESIPFRKEALELNPHPNFFRLLADAYKGVGDNDSWAKTLEESLTHDSGDLTTPRIQSDLANYYCNVKKDPERALPFAKSAAESGAGWAMDSLANVYEHMEEWDEAEMLRSQNAMRYDLPLDWYKWCVYHQRGNIDAAKRYALQADQRVSNSTTIIKLQEKFAISLFFDRKLDSEVEQLLLQKSTGPWSTLQLYLYHKKRNNIPKCEALLEDLKSRVANIEANPKSPHKLLAEFGKTVNGLIESNATPGDWKAALSPMIQQNPDYTLAYFAGAFLELQEEVEAAKVCYQVAIDSKVYSEINVTLSRLALNRLQ